MSDDTSSRKVLPPEEAALYRAKTKTENVIRQIRELELEKALADAETRRVNSSAVRHLAINDAIVGQNTDLWILALQTWERRNPGEPITIDINSPGGSVTDGLSLFDQIRRMRRKGHHITTRGTGLVASMAAVLLQAGDVRIMDARAKLLVHEGSTSFGGGSLSVAEQDDYRAFSELLRVDILDILCERATITRKQMQARWRRKDWYLGAEEALSLGLCDAVE